jgi:outer membrane immunogenic protein
MSIHGRLFLPAITQGKGVIMKRTIMAAGAAFLVCSVSAFAADMPVKAPAAAIFDWGGFYLGGNVGYAGDGRVLLNDPNETVANYKFNTKSGFLGGGQLGYNWRIANLLVGFEGDLGYLGLHQTFFFPPGAGFQLSDKIRSGLNGDITGRLGVVFDRLLVYGKGGAAFYTNSKINDPGEAATTSGNMTGWTAGGGFEYEIAPRWSVKAEYMYLDVNGKMMLPTDGDRFRNHLTAQTAKIGLNYFFGK